MWFRLKSAGWYRSLLAWSLIAAALGAGSVAVYTYNGYQRAAADLVIERDGQVALLSAARLSAELAQFEDSLLTLARTPGMIEGQPGRQQEALAEAALRLVVFDGGVILLDNHGRVIGASPPRPDIMGTNWSDRETFRQVLLKADTYISDASNDGAGGQRVVSVGVPILGPNSEFRGALIGLFNIGESTRSSLYASIVRLRLVQSGSIVILDGKNLVIYSTSPGDVGTVQRPPDVPSVANAPGAGSGRILDSNGFDTVSAFSPVPATSWTLITEDDWAVLTSNTRHYRNLFLASLLVAALLPVVGTTVMRRQGWLGVSALDEEHSQNVALRSVHTRLSLDRLPVIPGWATAHRHRLSEGTQRDLTDMAVLEDGRLMLAYGRVDAQGADGALAAAALRTLWREAAFRLSEPAQALQDANQVLRSGFPRAFLARGYYAVLDPARGTLSYSLADHLPPVVPSQTLPEDPSAQGIALGRKNGSTFTSLHLELAPSERVFFFSQAMCDARSADKREFRTACFPFILANETGPVEAFADALLLEFGRFVRNSPYAPQEISFTILERLGPEEG